MATLRAKPPARAVRVALGEDTKVSRPTGRAPAAKPQGVRLLRPARTAGRRAGRKAVPLGEGGPPVDKGPWHPPREVDRPRREVTRIPLVPTGVLTKTGRAGPALREASRRTDLPIMEASAIRRNCPCSGVVGKPLVPSGALLVVK